MTISTSRLSYADCFQALDQAMDSATGVRLKLPDLNEATFMRMRIHTARSIDRRDNRERYAATVDHPLFGRSIYDTLVIRLRQDPDNACCWLYIEKVTLRAPIEDLSEVPDGWKDARASAPPTPRPLPAPEPQKQIEFKRRV